MFRILVLFIASFLGLNAFAQSPKQIEIVNANTFEYDESIGNRAKRLLGNVIFKQDNVLMYCDSAYFYSESNSLDAFSNVHIQQGDSIHAYGEFLKYDGNAKHAELRNNVKMLDKDMTLTTDILFYDTGKNIAWYIDGGKIVNKKNISHGQSKINSSNIRAKQLGILQIPLL